jgi:hypothetical protein
MKNLKHIKRFNESEEILNSELSKETSSSISDISDSKKYVYKYNHNGKDLYYYMELWSDSHHSFVSDINDARIFTGKQIKSFQLDNSFDLGSEIFCEGDGGYITLVKKPVRIEV